MKMHAQNFEDGDGFVFTLFLGPKIKLHCLSTGQPTWFVKIASHTVPVRVFIVVWKTMTPDIMKAMGIHHVNWWNLISFKKKEFLAPGRLYSCYLWPLDDKRFCRSASFYFYSRMVISWLFFFRVAYVTRLKLVWQRSAVFVSLDLCSVTYTQRAVLKAPVHFLI